MSMDPEERERQIREWSEELEKVRSGWMDRVGFDICRHWFWVNGQRLVTEWGLISSDIGTGWMDRMRFDISRHCC